MKQLACITRIPATTPRATGKVRELGRSGSEPEPGTRNWNSEPQTRNVTPSAKKHDDLAVWHTVARAASARWATDIELELATCGRKGSPVHACSEPRKRIASRIWEAAQVFPMPAKALGKRGLRRAVDARRAFHANTLGKMTLRTTRKTGSDLGPSCFMPLRSLEPLPKCTRRLLASGFSF